MTTAGREVASIWIFEGGSAGEIRCAAPRGATAHGSGAVGGGADVDLDAIMRKKRRGAAWIRSDSGGSTEIHHRPPLSASDRSRTKRGKVCPRFISPKQILCKKRCGSFCNLNQ
ncbi:unnamed protein product [Musa textilis]